jgi:hypothetical protein
VRPPSWLLAGEQDVDDVVSTLALAFADDPLWGRWALPGMKDRVAALTRHWRPFVRAGLAYDGVVLSPGRQAVAIWIPPGVAELDELEEAALTSATEDSFGPAAPLLFELYDRFAQARPKAPEHWCLSLLGTRSAYRGQGWGMRLVTDFLTKVDAENMPAYLESTNPANLARYGRAGFTAIGTFSAPDRPGVATPTVTTMWRPAAPSTH